MLSSARFIRLIAILSLMTFAVSDSSTSAQDARSNEENIITVKSSSGEAEIALAQHLQKVEAKLYGAYWCSHCYEQIYLFGQQAFDKINRIECDLQGKNAQPDLCKAASIKGFPTWEIKGQFYTGTQSLADLAKYSGYQGVKKFNNSKPIEIPQKYRERNQNKQTLLETQLEKTFPSFKQKDFSQRLLSPNTETKLHPVQEN
jgi:hypothetical protein